MSKVYLVHAESGEYSDWTFEPEAVFTTREAAVAWIEARRFRVVEDECELLADFGNSYHDGEETVAFSKPTTHDGETWMCHETTDGRTVSGSYYDKTWFVDEMEFDPTEGGGRMTHELKILRQFADAVMDGRKTFEVRRNDRGFEVGDTVVLKCVDDDRRPIDHAINGVAWRITYVLSGWGIEDGYVVFGIEVSS